MQASIDYGISDRQDGQRQGGSFTFGQVGEKGNIIAGVNYNKFDADLVGRPRLLQGCDLPVRRRRHRPRLQPQPARPHHPDRTAPGRRVRLRHRHPHPGCRRHDARRLPLLQRRARLVQLPGRQPGPDPAGAHQCVLPGQLPDDRRHQRVHRGLPQQDRGELRDRGAAVRCARRRRADLGRQLLQPVRRQLRPRRLLATSTTIPDPLDLGRPAPFAVQHHHRPGGRRVSKASWATPGSGTSRSNYGHITQNNQSYGYMDYAGLAARAGSVVPGHRWRRQVRRAGRRSSRNCTPLNVFNIDDPQSIATLSAYEARPIYTTTYVQRGFEANASGELFNMPAGAAQLAFGAAWRHEYQRSEVDYIAIARADGTCLISQEACSSPVTGSFSVGELYAELFLPLLKDVPFAQALNLTLGSRYSNYSNFGNTVNSKVQVEWRPIDDLLFRGTVAEVFRAPSIGDLFAGPARQRAAGGPIRAWATPTIRPMPARAVRRPAPPTSRPAASPRPAWRRPRRGLGFGRCGYDLQPEQGKSFDWGVVYDPSWLPGFSASLDYWRLYLNDTITSDRCPDRARCLLPEQRRARSARSSTASRTARSTSSPSRPSTSAAWTRRAGIWRCATSCLTPRGATGSFGFDGTYIAQWDNDVDTTTELRCRQAHRRPLQQGLRQLLPCPRPRVHELGHRRLVGELAHPLCRSVRRGQRRRPPGHQRRRGLRSPMRRSSATNCPTAATSSTASTWVMRCRRSTRAFEVGVDNVFDKQPPLLYQNNVLNANTDSEHVRHDRPLLLGALHRQVLI